MTPQQINLVQASFEQVKPIAATAADLFYKRLFELDPALKPLTKGDMQRQGMMLMNMIGTAVAGLSKPEAIIPAVRALGERHVGYGVKNEHYATVGEALLWTLGAGLGAALTADVKEARTSAYGLLAGVMQGA